MKFLKWLLIIVVALVALVLIVAAFMPNELKVERSITVNAPPNVVYDKVTNYNNWADWSIWSIRDTSLVSTITGEPGTIGHKMAWEGNPDSSGTGEQEIIEINDKMMKGLVTFHTPWESQLHQQFDFKEQGSGTEVVWTNTMELDYPLGRFMGGMMEDYIGKDMEIGLSNLKTLAENSEVSGLIEISIQEVESRKIYSIIDSTDNMGDISGKFAEVFGEVLEFVQTNNIQMAGAPLSITHEWDPQNSRYVFEAGIPVSETNVEPTGRIKRGQTSSGTVVKGTHQGPYETLESSYNKLFEDIGKNNMEFKGMSWEEYVSDPGNTPQEELITFIYLPVEKK